MLALAASLAPINLASLNKKAEMLKRTDQKYLVPATEFLSLSDDLRSRFFVLEHKERRIFRYESVYFDDAYRSYREHHQGRRRRLKIRTRLYADCDLCYLEIKTKSVRGRTDKQRKAYPLTKRHALDADALAFIDKVSRQYGVTAPRRLKPKISVTFDRITLVAKQGRERVTIDTNLRFRHGNKRHRIPEDLLIVETKTRSGNGIADRLLRRRRIRPQTGCSKYCIGVADLGLVRKKNNFLPVLKRIHHFGHKKASA